MLWLYSFFMYVTLLYGFLAICLGSRKNMIYVQSISLYNLEMVKRIK